MLQLHGDKVWNVWSAEGARTQVTRRLLDQHSLRRCSDHCDADRPIPVSPRLRAQPLPYMDEQAGKDDELLYERELGEPELRCTLRRGHVLYIPRGAPHVARTDGSPSPSLHLTIAIPTADLSWGGFVMQAAAAAAGVSKWMALRPRDVELDFRRALPLGPLPPPPPLRPLSTGDEPAAAAAAAKPPPQASVGAEAWVATHTGLSTGLHDVTYAEARCVMRNKLLSKARAQWFGQLTLKAFGMTVLNVSRGEGGFGEMVVEVDGKPVARGRKASHNVIDQVFTSKLGVRTTLKAGEEHVGDAHGQALVVEAPSFKFSIESRPASTFPKTADQLKYGHLILKFDPDALNQPSEPSLLHEKAAPLGLRLKMVRDLMQNLSPAGDSSWGPRVW